MLPPKTIYQISLAGALAGAMVLAAGSLAQTTNSLFPGTNPAPALMLRFLPGEIVGHEQIVRACLQSGTNEFMFVVPNALRTESPRGGMIAMGSPDMKYDATVRVVGPPPGNPEIKQALQERIASQYTGASGLQEITATVADRQGTGFQLRQVLQGLAPRQVKILWVPFQAGLVEFTLDAESDSLAAAQGAFDMILLTFRSNERGKTEFVPRSDKS